MKKTISAIALCLCTALGMQAQTLNITTGEVTYAHRAANAGEMTFADGSTLTVEGRTYRIADITKMAVADGSVADGTVSVVYNGTSAAVTVAGNIARYITATASGATVSIVQSDDLQQEVTYTLSGTSADGSFAMDGSYKANFVLDNLSLASTTGAAINIADGKKIGISLTGTNTLADGKSGAQSACLYVDGNATFSGSGSLTINGNAKHGLSSGENVTFSSGTYAISAVGDGLHINEYLQVDGGSITVSAAGDGIDVGFRGVNKGTKANYANNGFLMLNGGTLHITTTGTATKALKADSTIVVAGAAVTAITSGSATYDTAEADFSSCSAVKTGGSFSMTSGSLTATSTGAGGKGINADGDITISGGTVTVTTTGALYEYNKDDTKPQGVKTDGNIYLRGGNVYVFASPSSGRAFKTDNTFSLSGGTVMGIGGKKSEPTTASQTYKTATKQTVTGGQTFTSNGVSYTVPSVYSNSSAYVLVSSPTM